MSFYNEMQAIARDLLNEFDQGGIEIGVATPGAGPPHNPGPTTYAYQEIDGAVKGVSTQTAAASAAHADGTLIQLTDLVVTIPAGIVVPKMTDKVRLSNVIYNMVKIDSKPAQGVAAAYIMIVRK